MNTLASSKMSSVNGAHEPEGQMAEVIVHQLELIGVEEARKLAEAVPTKAVRSRLLNRIATTHDLLMALPNADDLAFNHSGLCQTFLPHSRLDNNRTVWKRESGRFTLMVAPGVMSKPNSSGRRSRTSQTEEDYVGVPYGTKARLIMFHLQTEGLKSPTVPLGKNLSAFLRSLGLAHTGGPRGTVTQVREQCMRIARCTFTLQWTEIEANGNERTIVADTKIVEGLELWNATSDDWSATVELSEKFHSHLVEHAVPLDKRSIALLAGNSLGLDLYALFAYRLPKLKTNLMLTWSMLQDQIGSDYSQNKLIGRKVREVLPEVLRAYPHAKVEVERHGIRLKPSRSSVPREMVNGYRLVHGA
jgi:hypothetical protein